MHGLTRQLVGWTTWVVFLFTSTFSPLLATSLKNLSDEDIREVLVIARSISAVQPRLSDAKYMEFALGIYRASKKYRIWAPLLISIAQQESSFREHLKEGAAGEIGICQIRKIWLKNPAFIREFGKSSISQMKIPANSFMYAAWLLSELKETEKSDKVPYWTYYNARKLKNRKKYFKHVNRNLNKLRAFELARMKRETRYRVAKRPPAPPVARAVKAVDRKAVRPSIIRRPLKKTTKPFRMVRRQRRIIKKVPQQKRRITADAVLAKLNRRPASKKVVVKRSPIVREPIKKLAKRTKTRYQRKLRQAKVAKTTNENSNFWIPTALNDLKKNKKARKNPTKDYPSYGPSQEAFVKKASYGSPMVTRAAEELGVVLR